MKNTILIIEDDTNTAALITLYCEREGFHTLTAADGVSGLDRAGKERPDLVILDLMLPEMDGWEVCRRLRQKIEPNPPDPQYILTVRGVGYRFADRVTT